MAEAEASAAKTNAHGLDRELWKKMDGKYDGIKAKAILQWIKAVTKEDFAIPTGDGVTANDFFDLLYNGYYICLVVQAIEPECWIKIKQKKFKPKKKGNAFVFRNQIEVATKAMKQVLGLRTGDVCTSQDLYNRENANTVISCLNHLNSAAQKHKKYNGPYLEGGFKVSEENKRTFTKEQIAKGKAIVPFMNRGALHLKSGPQLDGAGVVKTAGNEDWVASSEVPMWNKGSLAHKSGPQLDSAGVVKTAGNEDWEASSAVPKLMQVVDLKEKKSNFDAHGVIKNA